jgi:hypothetical protein
MYTSPCIYSNPSWKTCGFGRVAGPVAVNVAKQQVQCTSTSGLEASLPWLSRPRTAPARPSKKNIDLPSTLDISPVSFDPSTYFTRFADL